MKNTLPKQLVFIHIIIILLISLNGSLQSSACPDGCLKCSLTAQNQSICSQCSIGFELVNNQCRYTLCSPYTYLQYDSKIVEQNPSQCKAVCNNSFEENVDLKVCQEIQQCSVSYNSKQSINRSMNEGIIENVYYLSKSLTMVVYPTYQALISTTTGSYQRDIVDSTTLTILVASGQLMMITTKNEIYNLNFINNAKTFIVKIEKGKLSKKTQIVQINWRLDFVVTSYDDGLDIVYFTPINLTEVLDINQKDPPSLSTKDCYLKVIDAFVIRINPNQTITIYAFYLDMENKLFTLEERQQTQSISNFAFPYHPILEIFQYSNFNYEGPRINLFVQDQSKYIFKFTYNCDDFNVSTEPIDFVIVPINEQPDNIKLVEETKDDENPMIAVKFNEKISFYTADLEYKLSFEKPNLTDYDFYLDKTLEYQQIKMFILYTSLNLVTTHIVDFSTLTITDKSQLLTQIQNPLRFLSYYSYPILGGGFGMETESNTTNDRNLEFGNYKEFSLYVFSDNLQKIDVDTEETNFVVNPFSQKKWTHSDTINEMAHSEEYQILLTCSQDGTIMAWSTIQNMNPVFLYFVRKQQENCRNVHIHKDKWVIGLFNKSIIIFHLRNEIKEQEFTFLQNNSHNDVQQFINHSQDYILLYFDSQFTLLKGDDLTIVSQSNFPAHIDVVTKVFFLENFSIIMKRGNDKIQLFKLTQTFQFPSSVEFEYTSQHGDITYLDISFNQSTSLNEIFVGLKERQFVILNESLDPILQHSMIEGFPIEAKKNPMSDTYILFAQNLDQNIAYQYFHYLLDKSTNTGTILGRGYSLKYNLGIHNVEDYRGKTIVNYLCTMPYSFFTLILRVTYRPDNKSIGFGNYVFQFGKGITEFINQDNGNVQYYSGVDGSLSFDTNSWNSVQRLQLLASTLSQSIVKVKSSTKLEALFVIQNEVNIYNIHTNSFIGQIKFKDDYISEPVKKIIINDKYSRVIAFKNKQLIMKDYINKIDQEFLSMNQINGVILDEQLQRIYIYGSNLVITNLDLLTLKIIHNINGNYQIEHCQEANIILVCKTSNSQILIYNIETYEFITSIQLKNVPSTFKFQVDSLYNQIFITAQNMQVFDFGGNLISKYDSFTYEVMDLQLFGIHIAVLTKSRNTIFSIKIYFLFFIFQNCKSSYIFTHLLPKLKYHFQPKIYLFGGYF